MAALKNKINRRPWQRIRNLFKSQGQEDRWIEDRRISLEHEEFSMGDLTQQSNTISEWFSEIMSDDDDDD